MRVILQILVEDRLMFFLSLLGALLLFYVALDFDNSGSIKNKLNKIQVEKNISEIMSLEILDMKI